MTVINIITKNNKIIAFSANMHAQNSLACAGISSLTQATYIYIESYLKKEIYGEADKGKLSLRLINPEDADDKTEASFRTMLIGLQEIQKLYPKNVKVIIN